MLQSLVYFASSSSSSSSSLGPVISPYLCVVRGPKTSVAAIKDMTSLLTEILFLVLGLRIIVSVQQISTETKKEDTVQSVCQRLGIVTDNSGQLHVLHTLENIFQDHRGFFMNTEDNSVLQCISGEFYNLSGKLQYISNSIKTLHGIGTNGKLYCYKQGNLKLLSTESPSPISSYAYNDRVLWVVVDQKIQGTNQPADFVRISQTPFQNGVFSTWRVLDGILSYREGVSQNCNFGTDWIQIDGQNVNEIIDLSVNCFGQVCWAVNSKGEVFERAGLTERTPTGTNWVKHNTHEPVSSVFVDFLGVVYTLETKSKILSRWNGFKWLHLFKSHRDTKNFTVAFL